MKGEILAQIDGGDIVVTAVFGEHELKSGIDYDKIRITQQAGFCVEK
ncbi:MAG: hypothetical protein K2O32_02285 [Acetatifactor sp.]|nr:hypothetical protein [Acetatifactor sp.]